MDRDGRCSSHSPPFRVLYGCTPWNRPEVRLTCANTKEIDRNTGTKEINENKNGIMETGCVKAQQGRDVSGTDERYRRINVVALI